MTATLTIPKRPGSANTRPRQPKYSEIAELRTPFPILLSNDYQHFDVAAECIGVDPAQNPAESDEYAIVWYRLRNGSTGWVWITEVRLPGGAL